MHSWGSLLVLAWGACATTLRTATLALVHSTAEYCAPAWGRSAHTRLIDPAINDTLCIATGCLSPTPADNLPILAGIQHAELRCSGATLSLARRAMEPGHLLHSALTRPLSADARCLILQKQLLSKLTQLSALLFSLHTKPESIKLHIVTDSGISAIIITCSAILSLFNPVLIF